MAQLSEIGELNSSVGCAMAPLDCAWRNWNGITRCFPGVLRHGAMELRMAQLKLEKEEFSPVLCAMAQRICAWRN
ncbi:hypothetical protein L195_g046492 [Trifolium pratense]|uniref:Uncharacterized protein n=1 Tax=Trifolium pratense TaxID=57577 RepID=A0A2K3MHV9_TRIPR|nr:hypothetical protein L195_g046492 [Trifolium pratense]